MCDSSLVFFILVDETEICYDLSELWRKWLDVVIWSRKAEVLNHWFICLSDMVFFYAFEIIVFLDLTLKLFSWTDTLDKFLYI